MMDTKERLAQELEKEYQTPSLQILIKRVREGDFDEFQGKYATPLVELVKELRKLGLYSFSRRIINGEFDATKEEAEAWFEKEGKDLLLNDLLKKGHTKPSL